MDKTELIKVWDRHLRLYLKFTSLLRPDNHGTIRMILFYFQKLFFVVSTFGFTIPNMIYSYNIGSLKLIIRCVVGTVSSWVWLVIMWIWLLNGKVIEQFFNEILKCNEWKNGKKHLVCSCRRNLKQLRIFKMVFNFYLIEMMLISHGGHILGFFNGTFQKREYLPYSGVIFGNYYEESYIFQWACLFMMTSVITTDIIILLYIVAYIGYEFEDLASHFANCIFEALIDTGVPQKSVRLFSQCFINSYKPPDKINSRKLDWAIANQIRTDKFDKALAKILKKYICRHQELLKLNKQANEILKPLLFTFIGVSVLSNTVMLIYSITEYDFLVINTIFMTNLSISICFLFGDILCTKSDKVQEAICNIPWYLCNPKSRKTFLFILMQNQKSVSINIIWIKLNSASLLKLYNHLYTFIAMLRPFMLRKTW